MNSLAEPVQSGKHQTDIVGSSNVAHVMWEDDTLYVRFVKGTTYRYVGPTLADYKALVTAPSVGIQLHKGILSRFKGILV